MSNCQICSEQIGRYSCPRCKIFYCSVSCYQSRKHIQCSEEFYEQWVREEMQNRVADPEERKKMLEILQRTQETDSEESLDSDDEEAELDLGSRMSNVNLDDGEGIWENLTLKERKEFQKLVTTGNIIKLIPEWVPWWKTKKRKTLIQDCEEEEFDPKELCPVILHDIPQLSKLTKSEPSPNIPFMMVNVLAAYCYTVRWFKGTYKDMPIEAISTMMALSAVLRNNAVFKNSIEAFVAFNDDLSKCKWLKEFKLNEGIINEDLKDIIYDMDNNDLCFTVKAALSDIESVSSLAVFTLKTSKTNYVRRFSGDPPKVSDLRLLSKKMIFYLSWTVEKGSLLLNTLSNFL